MQRHTMRKVREVLRLRLELGRSHREIGAATGLSKGSVSDYLSRAAPAGLTWEVACELGDAEVEALLFTRVGAAEPPTRAAIDFDWVQRELRRNGVTLQLLWIEYIQGRGRVHRANRAGDVAVRVDARPGRLNALASAGHRIEAEAPRRRARSCESVAVAPELEQGVDAASTAHEPGTGAAAAGPSRQLEVVRRRRLLGRSPRAEANELAVPVDLERLGRPPWPKFQQHCAGQIA